MYPNALLAIAALGAVTSAFDLPDNLKQIYDNHLVSNSFFIKLIVANAIVFVSLAHAKTPYLMHSMAALCTVAISPMPSS
jgi:small basic protein